MTSSWMLVAGFLFAAMGIFVKLGAQHFGAAELAFYRSLVTLLAVCCIVILNKGTVRSAYLGTHAIRGVVGAISLVGYFYAISRLPLATAQTLNYTSPIFLAIVTTVVLGERFSPWLLAAIVMGFAGVGMLLQPNFEEGKEGAALVGLFSGVLASWAYLSVRTLGRLGEPDWRVVFWFALIATAFCAAWQLATSTFHPLRWDNVWILAGLGACGTLAQLTMTRAYRTGNTLVVSAFSYSTIVFGTIATIVLWNDRLTPLEWAGMATIIGSGIVAMRVEKKEQLEEAGFES
ncbi:MAG: DMT family transporter [Usitatibacter sp.]